MVTIEIWTMIASFVKDRMYMSMTCKLFQDMLQNMYDTKQLTNLNDPYVFKYRYQNIKLSDKIKYNKHFLNYVNHHVINATTYDKKHIINVLTHNCKSNNVTKPDDIKKLIDMYVKDNVITLEFGILVYVCLIHKSRDILKLMASYDVARVAYAITIFVRYKYESNIDIIVRDMDRLVRLGVTDYDEIYRQSQNRKNYIYLDGELRNYLKWKTLKPVNNFPMNLPSEMWTHILSYVKDKIYVEMVCKTFQYLLKKMHMTKKLTIENINDPYILKVNTEEFKINYIQKIHNHDCLNLLTYQVYCTNDYEILKQYIFIFLRQNCIKNNISRPDYIHKLINLLNVHYTEQKTIKNILIQTLKSKSYDILMLFLEYTKARELYPLAMIECYENEMNIDVITKEIDLLVERKVMTYMEIYHGLNSSRHFIFLRYELFGYLDKKHGIKNAIVVTKEADGGQCLIC